MARHAAADGAGPDPLVASALERRPITDGGAHRPRTELPGREGPVGWPGPEPDDERGGPIGWPGGLPDGPGAEHPVPRERPAAETPTSEAPTSEQRRGWRRLLSRQRAA